MRLGSTIQDIADRSRPTPHETEKYRNEKRSYRRNAKYKTTTNGIAKQDKTTKTVTDKDGKDAQKSIAKDRDKIKSYCKQLADNKKARQDEKLEITTPQSMQKGFYTPAKLRTGW